MPENAAIVIRRVKRSSTLRRVGELIAVTREGRPPFLNGAYYVAVRDGRILGCAAKLRRSPHLTEIRHLSVIPEARRQGIARALVAELLGRLETPVALAVVREDNPASMALFESLGFGRAIVFPAPVKGGEKSARLHLLMKAAPAPTAPDPAHGGSDGSGGSQKRGT